MDEDRLKHSIKTNSNDEYDIFFGIFKMCRM